jgi:hypothetical protein
MAERVRYQGYEILLEAASTGWAAWILYREVPQGRVSGHRCASVAVAAAKQEINRHEPERSQE